MHRVLLLALSLLLLTSPVSAAPLLLNFDLARDGSQGGGHIDFGWQEPAVITIPITGACLGICGWQPDMTLDFSGERAVTGTFTLRTGALLSLALVPSLAYEGGSVNSVYTYAPGTITVGLAWVQEGAPMTGGFTVPIPGLTFTAIREDTIGLSDYPYIDHTLAFGPFTLDSQLSRFLGVSPFVPRGEFYWFSDGISGDPSSAIRRGRTYLPGLYTDQAQPIPEPATLVLFGLGLVLTAWWRRRAAG